jgi:hypothetical protein
MSLNVLLVVVAILEGAAGLALVIMPELVVRLILGGAPGREAAAVGRVAGLALISLGLACWPGRGSSAGMRQALRAMLA